jgi:hypothetical protein
LAKQLADVLRELESLPDAKEASKVDDLAAKRAARRSGSKVDDGPAPKRVRGGGGGRARS